MQQHLNEHKRETQIICTAVPLGGTLDCEARLRALTLTETLDTYEAQTISLCLSSVSVHYVLILSLPSQCSGPACLRTIRPTTTSYYTVKFFIRVIRAGEQTLSFPILKIAPTLQHQ